MPLSSTSGNGSGSGGTDNTTTTTTNSTSTTTNNNSHNNGNGNNATELHSVNAIEAEYNHIADRRDWNAFFLDMREKSEREAIQKHFSTSESEKSQNRCLNRYRDVNPYDHSRVKLHRGSVDYINANLVKLERADRKYVLTQGPLSDTVGHYWLMVWEQKTTAILMLNKLVEKKQVKCFKYWPDRKGAEHALKLDDVKLNVEFMRCEEYKNYIRRWFKLIDLESKQEREIMQFHYTTWPDFGIPSSPVAFLQFLKQVRDSGALDPSVGPAVVHCSAGIGRSGTFCLVDCCLVLIEKEGVNNVSVQDVLYELRRYRMGLIQTADQLYFSYQAIIEGIKLLKDETFLNYKESPIVRDSDERSTEQYNMEEIPPPLPPRTHSLLPLTTQTQTTTATTRGHSTNNGSGGKPLPKIPASESFNDELYANDNQLSSKDALNNFINSEKLCDNNISIRPLPPLPTQPRHNSLERVHESDSDENPFCDNDDDDDDDDDDDEEEDDVNDVDEENGVADENKNSDGHHVGKMEIVGEKLSHAGEQKRGAGGVSNGNNTLDNSNESSSNQQTESKKSNGIAALSSPDTELKRRKLNERQRAIEKKVNEIKRKTRKAEDNKKRRHLNDYYDDDEDDEHDVDDEAAVCGNNVGDMRQFDGNAGSSKRKQQRRC